MDRRRSRRAQRGMTVYIVVLVVGMLSAVGVFASRSASLSITQAGYYRQMVQTHYVTEYGVHASLAAMATDPAGYVAEFERQSESFFASAEGAVASAGWKTCRTAGENQRCFKFGIESVEERFDTGIPLFIGSTTTDTDRLGQAGSLGRARVIPHFIVEATDVAQVVAPIEGQRTSEAPVAFYSVTLSATGQVGPPIDAATELAGANDGALRSTATSLETARIQATLGPLPSR